MARGTVASHTSLRKTAAVADDEFFVRGEAVVGEFVKELIVDCAGVSWQIRRGRQ